MFRKLYPVIIASLLILSLFKVGVSYVSGEKGYVDTVEEYIKNVLALAKSKGIDIPNGLEARVDKALEYLELARETDNVLLSYKYAVEASIEFAPVYAYIEKNMDIEVRHLSRDYVGALEIRLEVLKELRERVKELVSYNNLCLEYVGQAGGCINLDVENFEGKISELEAELSDIMANIDGYSEDEILSILNRVDSDISSLNRELNSVMSSHWRAAGVYRASRIVSTMIIYKILMGVNLSIHYINQNDTEKAINILTRLSNLIDIYLHVINKSRIYMEKRGVIVPGISEISSDLIDTLKRVREYINSAVESLQAGDTASALTDLELAVKVLESYLETHGIRKMLKPEDIEFIVSQIEDIRKKLRERLDRIIGANQEAILNMLNNLEQRIKDLVNRYEAGQIPKDVFIMSLKAIRTSLQALKARIKNMPGIDQSILEEIDRLLNWVNQLINKYS